MSVLSAHISICYSSSNPTPQLKSLRCLMRRDNTSSDRGLRQLLSAGVATPPAHGQAESGENISGNDPDQDQFVEVKWAVNTNIDDFEVFSLDDDSEIQAALLDGDLLLTDFYQSLGMSDLDDFDIDKVLDEETDLYSQVPTADFSTTSTPDLATQPARSSRDTAGSLARVQLPISNPLRAVTQNPGSFLRTRSAKVKYELERLRQQVQEFERKLDRLKLSPTSALSPPSSRISPPHGDEVQIAGPAPQPTRWKDIAKQQVELAQKSEAANLELKVMLSAQQKFARSLSRVLRKHQDLSVGNNLKLCHIGQH